MKIKTTLLSAAFCTVIGSYFAIAQEKQLCGNPGVMDILYKEHPELKLEEIQYEAQFQKEVAEFMKNNQAQKVLGGTGAPKFIIPLVFHIIHNYGAENVADDQIIDAVNILNRDYRKRNNDTISIVYPFVSKAPDTEIEFRLAQIDPSGNCTNGIEHIQSLQTNVGGNGAKINQWPRSKYMNIWVVAAITGNGGTAAGYALFPASVAGAGFPLDGVVILHNYVGSIKTSSAYTSRALTHEIGHTLSLEHPWGATNNPGVTCGDDGVSDTPLTKGHADCSNLSDITCTAIAAANMAYNFGGVTTASGVTDTTKIVQGADAKYKSFKAVGVGSNSIVTKVFGFDNWGTGGVNGDTTYANMTGSINTGRYYEVKMSPNLGNLLNFGSVKFNFKRNTTGVRTFSVRSSFDGFTTNLTAASTSSLVKVQAGNIFYSKFDTVKNVTGCSVSSASLKNVTDTLTFRFYSWNAEDAAGTFELDSVLFAFAGGVVENVQNYMDYSYCSRMFTVGQKTLMTATLNNTVAGRSTLGSAANNIATGTDYWYTPQICKPHADFSVNANYVCAGGTLQFTNATWGASLDSLVGTFQGNPGTYYKWVNKLDSVRWNFADGNPSTSNSTTTANVMFSTPGWKQISLTAYTKAGSDTKTMTQYIYVSSSTVDYTNSFTFDFEDQTKFDNEWFVVNQPNNPTQWAITNTVAFMNTHSLKLNAYFNPTASNPFFENVSDVDEVITPSVDFSGMASTDTIRLVFKVACATRAITSANMLEALRVYSSENCGALWTKRYEIVGPTLMNAGYSSAPFVPASNQWVSKVVKLPVSLKKPNVRFKFKFENTTPYSNNIYLDAINFVNNTTGVEESITDMQSLDIYPNPASKAANITYSLTKKQKVKIGVYDVVGNLVADLKNEMQTEGDYAITLNRSNLTNGLYFVRFELDGQQAVKKVIFSE